MKRVFEYIAFCLVFILIFVSAVSAACVVPSQTIITLYSQNNTHVAIYNSTTSDPNAVVSICYDSIFGQSYTANSNPWQCNLNGVNNRIVGIYANNNSHVSSGATYDVCYGDLSCQIVSGSPNSVTCPVGDQFLMSISDLNNAHAASDGSYSYKVCCKNSPSTPSTRDIIYANWTNSDSGSVITLANYLDNINITINSINIPNYDKINITVYNASSNTSLFADPISVSVINNQINYKTNLTFLNATGNVGIGGKIYFNASYVNSSGYLFANVKSGDLEIVDYSIVSAKWLDMDNDTITSTIKGDLVQMYINTTGFSGERVNVSLYFKSSPDKFVRDYKDYLIGPTGELLIRVNLTNEYSNAGMGNLVSGDRLFFVVNNSDNFHKKSSDIRITDIVISELGCCEYITDAATCNARAPTAGGSCVIANINQTCSANIVTKCSWNSLTSKCNTNVARIDATGAVDGSCTTSYTSVDERCIDGFRRISVSVTNTSSTCSASPFCLDPCDGGICTVPCRNVALLPFFSTLQIITSVGLIALMYFLFRRKL